MYFSLWIVCFEGNYIELVGLFLCDIFEYLEFHFTVVTMSDSAGIYHIELAIQFHL